MAAKHSKKSWDRGMFTTVSHQLSFILIICTASSNHDRCLLLHLSLMKDWMGHFVFGTEKLMSIFFSQKQAETWGHLTTAHMLTTAVFWTTWDELGPRELIGISAWNWCTALSLSNRDSSCISWCSFRLCYVTMVLQSTPEPMWLYLTE